jgi:two-component system nitrate/nitrite response regulator NarL
VAPIINLAIVDDDRMLIEGLQAWARGSADLRLSGAFATVDAFFEGITGRPDVVLLDLMLRDDSEPDTNVRRLRNAGHQLENVTAWTESGLAATGFAAGAQACISKDQDLATLAATIRQVAAGEAVYTPELAAALLGDERTQRPRLSARERQVLIAYASGMTLEVAARHIGVKPGTAKTYLDRVKAKYRAIGRPAYTKLELAQRIREDCHQEP